MQSKEMDTIIKILGILGMVFCLVALLTPWGGAEAFTFGLFGSGYSSPFYIDLFTNPIFQSYAGQFIFFGITMIIIFILTLVTLILSIFTIKNIRGYQPSRFLTLGILLMISFILYIISVSILSSGFGGLGMYGIGFVMALIGAIMFFIAYGIKKFVSTTPSPVMYQQPIYQQPTHTQAPTQYYQQQAPPQHYQPPPPVQQPVSSEIKSKTKFCPSCGTQLQANARFCPECGNQL
jgi:phosphoglycerol transferase MdoB-like AlkP superfamily enzyme